MERLPTRLDGLVLLAPTVHGDERGFFMETYREDAWGRHGIPSAFVQDNHSRSRRGTLRGIHFQTHPGQGKLVRVARGRVLDVAVDLRRGSPTFGEWESFELDDVRGRQLWIPVGFGHGFCVLSEEADFVYKCTNYYDAATESGISFADPDVGIEWPRAVELLYSERDRDAPRLAEIADDAAVHATARDRDGRFAPSPTGTLHVGNLRTALLAWLFARSQGARFLVRMEDLDPGRVRMDSASEQLEDLRAIGLDWDGEVLWQSARHEAYEAAIARLRADGRVYECFCTRAEIRAAASAPHGPLPEGAYPGTCLRLTDGERRRKRAGGRPPALRLRADAERIAFEDRLAGRYEMAVDDFVVRRNDGAAAYNLAVMVDDAAQGIGEVVRGADLIDSTPRQILVARLLGLPEPSWAHVPLVLGPDGARLAKRHGSVTLRDVAPDAAVRWMARTLGFEGATSAAEMLERFDPERLPREPTRFAGVR